METAPTTLVTGDASPLPLEERRAAVREIVDRFEQAWHEGRAPAIDDYLPLHPELRLAALVELAPVDLERKIKSGAPARVEDYFSRYPELAADRESSLDLVTAEYELRRRHEPSLSIGEFVSRFPEHADNLTRNFPPPPAAVGELPLLSEAKVARLPTNGSGSSNTIAELKSAAAESSWRAPATAIVLSCPDCRATISLQSSPAGEMRCPSCAGLFRVEPENGDGARGESLTQIGKFRLLERIGRGAFGAVYRAHDLDLDRIVAVKIPRSGAFSTIEEEDRFVREARSIAKLSHPAIVPVFEVGRTNSFPYIVCEFVEGVTLARALAHRRFEFRDAAELAALVADALDHAHKNGVIHRDLKPSNIMVKPRPRYSASRAKPDDLRVRLMDFGLARREDGEATVTVQGQILGTPAYMSPEQARGDAHRVDGRADVYSLGALLYEMLVGEPPFRGNVRMLLHQVLHDEPRPLRKLNDRIPRDLETICLKCLEKRPDQRYASAGELAADLRRWMNGEPILARPLGRAERAVRWAQRRPALAFVSTLLIVGAVAAFATIAWQLKQTDEARHEERAARLISQQALRREQIERRRAERSGRELALSLSREQAALRTAQEERGKAEQARRDVEDRLQRVSRAHRLASAAASERADHPIRSLLLAAEGLQLTHRPGERRVLEAEQSLRDALAFPGADTPSGFEGPFEDVAPHASGRWLIARTDAQTLVIRSLSSKASSGAGQLGAGGRAPATYTLRDEAGYSTAMTSPDGRWLAALDGANELQIASLARADVQTKSGGELQLYRFPLGPAAFEGGYWVAAFSADGRWFAAAGQDRQVRLWRLPSASGEPSEPGAPVVLSGHSLSIRQIAFSADGSRLLTASYDRSLRIYALRNGSGQYQPDAPASDGFFIDEPLVLQVGRIPEGYFASRGQWLLTTTQEGYVSLWDLTDPNVDSPSMTRTMGRIVTPSPDGRWMVVHTESFRPGLFSRLWIWRMPRASSDIASSAAESPAPVSPIEPPMRLHLRIGSVVKFSPDSRHLAAIAADGSVCLWRTDGNDPAATLREIPGDDSLSLSFSGDSQLMAVGGDRGDVRLWRLERRTEESTEGPTEGSTERSTEGERWSDRPELFAGSAGVTAVSVDRRLGRIVAGDRRGALRVFTFDPAVAGKSEPPVTMQRHEEAVLDLSLAAEGRWLVSTSDDGDSRLWDLARLDTHLSPHQPAGRGVAGPAPGAAASVSVASPGGDQPLLAKAGLFLQAEDDALALWDLSRNGLTGPAWLLPSNGFQPVAADVSAGTSGDPHRWLAAVDASGELRLWPLKEDGADRANEGVEAAIVIPSAEASDDGDAERAEATRTTATRAEAGRAQVAFSGEGQWLARRDPRGRIAVWRRAGGEWQTVSFAQPPTPSDNFYFAGERWLVTSSQFKATGDDAFRAAAPLVLWDLSPGDSATIAGPIPLGGASIDRAAAVAIAPGGRWLALVDGYGAVRLWRLDGSRGGAGSASGAGRANGAASAPDEIIAPQTYRLASGATSVKAIAFSGDGRRLAAAGETKGRFYHEALVWRLPEEGPPGDPLVLKGHLASLRSVAFAPARSLEGVDNAESVAIAASVESDAESPDEYDRLLVGGDDGAISVWKLADSQTQEQPPAVLTGHTAPVLSLAVTSDGSRAASFDAEGQVRLWSLDVTAQPPIVLTCANSPDTLSISPDDRYLIGGGDRVQIWRLDIDDLLKLAHQVAGRELTDSERRQYSLDPTPRAH